MYNFRDDEIVGLSRQICSPLNLLPPEPNVNMHGPQNLKEYCSSIKYLDSTMFSPNLLISFSSASCMNFHHYFYVPILTMYIISIVMSVTLPNMSVYCTTFKRNLLNVFVKFFN